MSRLHYSAIYDGQLQNLKIVKDVRRLLDVKVAGGGQNLVDMAIKQSTTLVPITIKYNDKYKETDGIFDRFYKGLAELHPDEIERCEVIMNDCIYYADLTAMNVFITTEIMKCHVQSYCGLDELDYEFNTHVGATYYDI